VLHSSATARGRSKWLEWRLGIIGTWGGLELATLGLEEEEIPIGALVVEAERVVAEAYWRWKTDHRLLLHPELAVLHEADARTETTSPDLTLYTTLEPCLLCIGAAASMFVNRIVYALPSDVDGAAGVFERWQPRACHPGAGQPAAYRVPEINGGFRADESAALVRRYLDTKPTGPLAAWARGLVTPNRSPPVGGHS
jgi:tRNA(adenine34) deaminase